MDAGSRNISLLDRAPPADERAEAALLGSLLVDPEAIATIVAIVKPEDFSSTRDARIYEAIATLYERRQPSDFVALAAELERTGQLEMLGGTAYLTTLASIAPTSLHAEAYARLVEKAALMRRLIGAGRQITDIGFENPPEVDEALDRAERLIFELGQRRVSQTVVPIRSALNEFF